RERLVTQSDIDRLSALFQSPNMERVCEFESKVRHHLAHPEASRCRIAVDETDAPAVLLVETAASSGMREIALLRHTNHPLAGTLIRHMLHSATLETGSETAELILVSDKGVSGEAI